MDVDEAMGIHLQEEITMEILSRLPVRSLLRFKCVSKFWMTLITEPYFKMKHLENNRNSQKLLVSEWCLRKDEFSLYCSSLSSVQQIEEVQKLDWPYNNDKPRRLSIYCCYDSLVLIGVSHYREYSDYKHYKLLLWNPSTRESIVLPNPKLPPNGGDFWSWGMGYDSTSDDYKILKIDHKSQNEILALKSGSWRLMDKVPECICPLLVPTESLVFVHGAFHWVGALTRWSLICFTISDEVYGEILLLEQMCSIYTLTGRRGVSVLGGMLCAYCHLESRTEDIFKFLVMKDYGIKESWTELFNIQGTGFFSVIPKYRFSDGEVLLYCKCSNHIFSVFRTSEGPFRSWPQSDAFQQVFVYTESMFFPKLIS